MGKTKIEWATDVWNPITGCTKVSPGCARCYAERIALRFGTGTPYLPDKATIRFHPDRLNQPFHWKRPRRIFVCSMSDLFHEDISLWTMARIHVVMRKCPQHIFQTLTKRPWRANEFYNLFGVPSNVWFGTSVENQVWVDRRVPWLLVTPAKIRFLSCEPLLKPLNLSPFLHGLQWVIIGGESGPRARKMDPEWVRDIVAQCDEYQVPVFVKQASGPRPGQQGDIPDDLWERKAWPEA